MRFGVVAIMDTHQQQNSREEIGLHAQVFIINSLVEI